MGPGTGDGAARGDGIGSSPRLGEMQPEEDAALRKAGWMDGWMAGELLVLPRQALPRQGDLGFPCRAAARHRGACPTTRPAPAGAPALRAA